MNAAELAQYRQRTEDTHRRQAGVTNPSFCCSRCKQYRLVAGRKRHPDGKRWLCRECAA